MKIICLGVGRPRGGPSPEWFGEFNKAFIKDYLSKSFEVKHIYSLPREEAPWRNHHRPYLLFGREINLPYNSLLIANEQTEKYVILTSFFDLRQLVNTTCDLDLDKMIMTFSGHYTQKIIDSECHKFSHKFKPWYFRCWQPDFGDHDVYYTKSYAPEVDRLYFRGLGIQGRREFVGELQRSPNPEIDESCTKVDPKIHEEECRKSRVCLSAPGIRDMCNRDVEYWKGGIPFIRPRFTNQLAVDIPDEVYIPVDFEPEGTYNNIPDHKAFASSAEEKYEEVKSNQKLLNDVSRAGLDFYEKYFAYHKIAENSYRMLEESGLFERE